MIYDNLLLHLAVLIMCVCLLPLSYTGVGGQGQKRVKTVAYSKYTRQNVKRKFTLLIYCTLYDWSDADDFVTHLTRY